MEGCRGGGGGFFLSHAEGGAQNVLGSFYAVACSFSHIEGGGDSLKIKWGGGQKGLTLSVIFPFCSLPLPVINDQSLNIAAI